MAPGSLRILSASTELGERLVSVTGSETFNIDDSCDWNSGSRDWKPTNANILRFVVAVNTFPVSSASGDPK